MLWRCSNRFRDERAALDCGDHYRDQHRVCFGHFKGVNLSLAKIMSPNDDDLLAAGRSRRLQEVPLHHPVCGETIKIFRANNYRLITGI